MEWMIPLMIMSSFGSMAMQGVNAGLQSQANQNNFDLGMANYQLSKDNLDWMKESQKQNWIREDTAYQRTKNDMLQAGLNPLSMQGTNGAGEIVSLPQLEAPQMQANHIPDFGSNMLTALSSVEQATTGKLQRDQLLESINAQKIKNARDLKNLGGYFDSEGNIVFGDDYKDYDYENSKLDYESKYRDYKHNVDAGIYASDTNVERGITAVTDWLLNGRGEAALNKLKAKYPWLASLLALLSGDVQTEVYNSKGKRIK